MTCIGVGQVVSVVTCANVGVAEVGQFLAIGVINTATRAIAQRGSIGHCARIHGIGRCFIPLGHALFRRITALNDVADVAQPAFIKLP